MGQEGDMSAVLSDDSIRVLVVDDHKRFRVVLRELLEDEGLEVADAGSTEAALRRLPGLTPHVVIVGVNLPRPAGVEAVRVLSAAAPAAALLVLALVADDEHVLQAARAGAVGYLLKDARLAQIVTAIRSIVAGQSSLSPRAARVLIEQLRRDAEQEAAAAARRLSEREREVLWLLAAGCDNSQIGDILLVSCSTVKHHVSRVLQKLHVDDRLQAATYALRSGLIDADARPN
jgi:DNA-binding NarL/FixJ family response regulator